jgi:hypothetical protein
LALLGIQVLPEGVTVEDEAAEGDFDSSEDGFHSDFSPESNESKSRSSVSSPKKCIKGSIQAKLLESVNGYCR